MKSVTRYYFGFMDAQEKWLNTMADKGYRLINSSKLLYKFEACSKSEYEYHVEFIADKSSKEAKEYKCFIEELGFRTISKNINLNYSLGKIKWRPYAKGTGQLATSPGAYNHEILIIEKKQDGKPFETHTDYDDLISYYSKIRNMYATSAALLILLVVFGRAYSNTFEFLTLWIKIIVGAIGGVMAYLAIRYSAHIYRYKCNRRTNE